MQQQFPRSLGLVVEHGGGRIRSDVRVEQEGLALLDDGIGIREICATVAQGLHLAAHQDDPRLDGRLDVVVMPRLPVLGDDLDAVVRFLASHGEWILRCSSARCCR